MTYTMGEMSYETSLHMNIPEGLWVSTEPPVISKESQSAKWNIYIWRLRTHGALSPRHHIAIRCAASVQEFIID